VLYPLVRGLDILQGKDMGLCCPHLLLFLKKTKSIKTQLSPMTTGLAFSLEDTIKRCFEKVLDLKDTIISPITQPKLKLKWVEFQAKKDHYTQMSIDVMQLYAEADDSDRAEDAQKGKGSKMKYFYEFDSDEESIACDTVEMKAARYLRNAKSTWLNCF